MSLQYHRDSHYWHSESVANADNITFPTYTSKINIMIKKFQTTFPWRYFAIKQQHAVHTSLQTDPLF